MPANLNSTEKLFEKHSSKPFNPKLAHVFFLSGMIEAWGRGFVKIKEACAQYNAPLPEYDINEEGIMVLCKACDRYLRILQKDINPVQNGQDGVQDMYRIILDFCKEPKTAQEIVDEFGFSNRNYFRRHYLEEMLITGKLKMTMPDKPSSKKQKYYS